MVAMMYRSGGAAFFDLLDDVVGVVVGHVMHARRLDLPVALRRAHRRAAEAVLLCKTCLHRDC